MLQRCSTKIQNLLQKFLLREPHAPPQCQPYSSLQPQQHPGGEPNQNPSAGATGTAPNASVNEWVPQFLFLQQCLTNSTNGRPHGSISFVPITNASVKRSRSEILDNNDEDKVNRVECVSRTSKKFHTDKDAICDTIKRHLCQSQEYLAQIHERTSIVSGDSLLEIQQQAQTLTNLLQSICTEVVDAD